MASYNALSAPQCFARATLEESPRLLLHLEMHLGSLGKQATHRRTSLRPIPATNVRRRLREHLALVKLGRKCGRVWKRVRHRIRLRQALHALGCRPNAREQRAFGLRPCGADL